ncbi:MAG TPA: DUF948 domain-containing protein [Gemmatimonadaceae bacterium]|nr:DUF948 domain-containing protein [Gemmatimonadaceae bacterium]
MIDGLVAGAAWLLQGAALQGAPGVASDTLVFRQVTADPGVFQKIASIASSLMTIAILVLTVVLVPAAWNFRNSYKRVNELLDKVYGDINPIMRHASVIADNVNYITTSLRADVQQVNQTVTTANQRVLQAVRLTERRLNEFNALLGVVQEEAERTFVSTAATVRGVRSGVERLERELDASEAEERLEHLDDELADALDDAFDDTGDTDDGNDRRDAPDAQYPRIRPRRGLA